MEILQAFLTAVFSAGAVWGVIRTELHYLRRDIDRAHRRLDRLHADDAWR